jgi:hypothetical protein
MHRQGTLPYTRHRVINGASSAELPEANSKTSDTFKKKTPSQDFLRNSPEARPPTILTLTPPTASSAFHLSDASVDPEGGTKCSGTVYLGTTSIHRVPELDPPSHKTAPCPRPLRVFSRPRPGLPEGLCAAALAEELLDAGHVLGDPLVGHEGDGLARHDAHEAGGDALPKGPHPLLPRDHRDGLHDACHPAPTPILTVRRSTRRGKRQPKAAQSVAAWSSVVPVYLGVCPSMTRCFCNRVLTTSSGLLTSGPNPPLSPPNSIDSHGSSSVFPAQPRTAQQGYG